MQPIGQVAEWLAGGGATHSHPERSEGSCQAEVEPFPGKIPRFARDDTAVIDAGHRRALDLALELPGSPLEAVMSNEVWEEVYTRLADMIQAHRTTLVFVNTRRMAERVARQLAERIGEDAVTAHH